MTNDIFLCFSTYTWKQVRVEYNNLLKNAFMVLFSMII
nr:MAG TPA: hypothetical protein [Bacteriophage sp.]